MRVTAVDEVALSLVRARMVMGEADRAQARHKASQRSAEQILLSSRHRLLLLIARQPASHSIGTFVLRHPTVTHSRLLARAAFIRHELVDRETAIVRLADQFEAPVWPVSRGNSCSARRNNSIASAPSPPR
jgi:hypothetical protein